MPDALPDSPSIEQLKKQAKELLRAFSRKDPSVIEWLKGIRRYAGLSPEDLFRSSVKLHDARYAVALRYGFLSWRHLSDHCAQRQEEKVMNKQIVEEFNELKDLPNRSMQRVLRELDASEVARALPGADNATREKVFANMSKRARQLIEEIVEGLGEPDEHQTEAAMAKVVSIFRKLVEKGDVPAIGNNVGPGEAKEQIKPVKIIQEKGSDGFSLEDLKTLFRELSIKAQASGLLSLESDVEIIEDPIIKKGLQLVVDGTDPSVVESIMRNTLDKEIQLMRMKYEAVIEAVMGIQRGDSSHILREILEARLP